MNNPEIVDAQTTGNAITEQSCFWMTLVMGWKREIGRVVAKSEAVNASPEVTAEVALMAGELMVLAEQLESLYAEIDCHKVNFPVANEEPDDAVVQWNHQHIHLYEKLRTEGERLRNLLNEMFRLDKAAYRRFLC